MIHKLRKILRPEARHIVATKVHLDVIFAKGRPDHPSSTQSYSSRPHDTIAGLRMRDRQRRRWRRPTIETVSCFPPLLCFISSHYALGPTANITRLRASILSHRRQTFSVEDWSLKVFRASNTPLTQTATRQPAISQREIRQTRVLDCHTIRRMEENARV